MSRNTRPGAAGFDQGRGHGARLAPRPRSQSAQAFVELALAIPLLLLLFVIVADFGRVYYYDLTLRDAVFAAARYGAMNPNDDAGIKSAAVGASNGVLTSSSVTVSAGIPRASGRPLVVTATYSFAPITPLVSAFTDQRPITVTRSATDIIK